MATFIMLPGGVTGTNEWYQPSTTNACLHPNVDNDNDDTDYCREYTNGHEITFTIADPSVSESAISSITSVQIVLKARYTNPNPSQTVNLQISQGGTNIANGIDTLAIVSGASYTQYTGTARTVSKVLGSVAWSYTNLEDLQLKLETTSAAASRTEVRVSYLYALVTYVEAGYGNDVMGVDSGDIAKIMGIATADISKVNGI